MFLVGFGTVPPNGGCVRPPAIAAVVAECYKIFRDIVKKMSDNPAHFPVSRILSSTVAVTPPTVSGLVENQGFRGQGRVRANHGPDHGSRARCIVERRPAADKALKGACLIGHRRRLVKSSSPGGSVHMPCR